MLYQLLEHCNLYVHCADRRKPSGHSGGTGKDASKTDDVESKMKQFEERFKVTCCGLAVE